MGRKFINGRTYYYKSRRDGDRVASDYLGAGAAAELVDRLLGIERDRRRQVRHDERDRLRAIAAAGRPLAAYHRSVQLVFLAAMDGGGYHRHERGPWRRRRSMVPT